MCREKATLKGEFSNKPLTETLVLRAELPCRDFKRELLLRSLSVVGRKVWNTQVGSLWVVPALAAQSNHLHLCWQEFECPGHQLAVTGCQPAEGHPSTTWWRSDSPYLCLLPHSASS